MVTSSTARHRSARPAPAVRNPERTRERIVAAALREFSARGLAGARVDRIARRARVNKRMLYHYFGNKEDLFREILRVKLSTKTARLQALPEDPADILAYWFDLALQDVDWVRLIEWEALRRDGRVTCEEERRDAFDEIVAELRRRQERGVLARDVDPRQLLLAMIALVAFPVAFPQVARLVTGLPPFTPAFRKRHEEFLRVVADGFRGAGR